MEISLSDNRGFKWHSSGIYKVRGYAYNENNQLLREESLIDYLHSSENTQHFINRLKILNGSFCIIIDSEDSTIVAVDRVSSIPIFYSIEEGGEVSLFDKLEIRQFSVDDLLVPDFLQTGYTTSNQTLIPNVYRLASGQYLEFNKQTKALDINYYYRHFSENFIDLTQTEHFKNLDRVSDNFISRLIKSANNRKIVIPLSGGYDSRYITTGLRKHNYENVICYTYGKKDSFEVDIAQKVAEKLNYPIVKITYDSESWGNLKSNPNFEAFVNYSFNFSSLTHVQDFMAMEYLTSKNLIPKDSIIVPGFCGDFLGGSLTPVEIIENNFESLKKEGLVDYIIRKHSIFSKDVDSNYTVTRENLSNYISQTHREIQSEDNFASLNDSWIVENRLSKFIINSLRVYEYFGFEWRIPLWDNELVEYWYTVPRNLRGKYKLYNTFLLESFFAALAVDFKKGAPLLRNKLFLFLRKFFPSKIRPFVKKNFGINTGEDVNNFYSFRDSLLEEIDQKAGSFHENTMNGVLALWIIEKEKKANKSADIK